MATQLQTVCTAAFVTYNLLGREQTVANGWHKVGERKAFVLQNSRGTLLGAVAKFTSDDVCTCNPEWDSDLRVREINNLWKQLELTLPEVDHVVVYVGSSGSETAVELAMKHVTKGKITFVACSCERAAKERVLRNALSKNAELISCECGGHSTMKTLYERFMATGTLSH